MGLELHINESSRGHWTCSLGDHRCDTHRNLADAVQHMQVEAVDIDEPELWVHFDDGIVEQLPTLPPLLEG